MKNCFLLLAGGLCLGLFVRPAAAAYVTGADLAGYCRGDKPRELYSCMNYIAGVIDYHVMMQSLGTAPAGGFCLSENLPLEKAAVVVMNYLKKSPQHFDFIAAPAVTMALHEAYPCGPVSASKKKKKKHG